MAVDAPPSSPEPLPAAQTGTDDAALVQATGQAPSVSLEVSCREERKRKRKAERSALLPFAVISCSYLLFTVTDGALRMIVLLHAYNLKFSALQVAIMFVLYELAGVFTNLFAGMAGARWGIKYTLVIGLCLQLITYGLLFAWNERWAQGQAIAYVTVVQMFGGVAKDLTKLGGKTVTKLVTPDEQSTRLFKLVSLLTGWKNSLKGVGYFLGSALILVSYYLALSVMLGLVLLALPFAIFGLDRNLGTAKKKNASLGEILDLKNQNLNWLSLARLFLFASRDFWFEVPLPFFLRAPSCTSIGLPCATDGSDCAAGTYCFASTNATTGVCANLNPGGGCGGVAWPRVVVGAVLGSYIILYGQFQSWTPQLVTSPLKQTPPNKLTEVLWGLLNCVPTLVMAIVAWDLSNDATRDPVVIGSWLIAVIASFALIFAVNSSIHSYLVVHYAKKEKVAASVGFYYMSNAVGRLLGTLGSGLIYTYVGEDIGPLAGSDGLRGLAACFVAGTISSLLAAGITMRIEDQQAGVRCGPIICVRPSTLSPRPSEKLDQADTVEPATS
mmetsp:Transcript_12042/g.34666  ORF Transcript_12042/g.34666 Transcript_12042/m.34666 type:complete len:556 (-) Transcript_12042:155-1822(-)